MPELRQPLTVAVRQEAGYGPPAPTPPPPGPCDTCGGPVSRYNPHGRCHACAAAVGWPEAPEWRPATHGEDCRCRDLRSRHPAGGKYRWYVPVTCPDCGEERLAPELGSHSAGPHCHRGYMTLCAGCARRAVNRIRWAA